MIFNREKFIADLRTLVVREVRWMHNVCNPDIGMDCINAPRWAYEQQAPLPEGLAREFDAYWEKPDGKHFLQVMRKWFIEIPKSEARLSDLYIAHSRGNATHMAVRSNEADPPMVIEAYRGDGLEQMLEQPISPARFRLIIAAFRIPDEI